ncbi:hypothetical protein BN11_3650004 [Nostocoides australiense Ben110]|uniref:FAD-binding FR-type domain-containing protein n=1 Tax=Nostocoides australiense Ben110 TaxID=1193182 RepID=W6JZ34_9MICO|nr:hypothetical protein [Tetrasphaera australiensis]CCH74021.1 hypothetical protein BN11_3650004 [Tetrasphaera australiensis Ben110]
MVVVRERRDLTHSIVEFTLARPDGSRLPDWAPGAHIDVVLPDGVVVLMFLGSANRDPRHWADPDRYDLTRDPSGHAGFGWACISASASLWPASRRWPSWARCWIGSRASLAAPPRRHLNNTLRGWESMPVRVSPCRSSG